MAPFPLDEQLYSKIHLAGTPHTLSRTDTKSEARCPGDKELGGHLPGQPRIPLNGPLVGEYIYTDLETDELDILSPHLWLIAKQDSQRISSLTHQRVRGRDIIITKNARLHLTWVTERVFLKPIPKYLLSHAF